MQDSGGTFWFAGLDFDEVKALFGIGKYQFSTFFQGIQRRVFYKGVGENSGGLRPRRSYGFRITDLTVILDLKNAFKR